MPVLAYGLVLMADMRHQHIHRSTVRFLPGKRSIAEGDMLNSLSPIFKLDRVKAAVLVLHGANDTNVPVIEAEQVVDHLRIRGIEVEYVLFPDEGHGFLKEANRIRSTTAIVNWFTRHLRPLTNH